jgi:hypothetical protein
MLNGAQEWVPALSDTLMSLENQLSIDDLISSMKVHDQLPVLADAN